MLLFSLNYSICGFSFNCLLCSFHALCKGQTQFLGHPTSVSQLRSPLLVEVPRIIEPGHCGKKYVNFNNTQYYSILYKKILNNAIRLSVIFKNTI